MDDTKIRVKSKDGDIIEFDAQVLKLSEYLKNIPKKDEIISLTNFDTSTIQFVKVLTLLREKSPNYYTHTRRKPPPPFPFTIVPTGRGVMVYRKCDENAAIFALESTDKRIKC